MAGSNSLMRYLKSYEDRDHSTIRRISTGLGRAVQAELGNTKTYKSNIRNYYKANGIIQAYRYADKEDSFYGSNNFDYDDYKGLKKEISTIMNNKGKYSEVYAAIEDALESGVGINEITSAVRNNSLRYKLETIDNLDKFFESLTHAEQETVKTAIAYEDYMFPWLDGLDENLKDKYGYDNEYGKYRPKIYHNNYTNYLQRHYRPYNYRRNFNYWQPPVIDEDPLEAFEGKKEWEDWDEPIQSPMNPFSSKTKKWGDN